MLNLTQFPPDPNYANKWRMECTVCDAKAHYNQPLYMAGQQTEEEITRILLQSLAKHCKHAVVLCKEISLTAEHDPK